MKWSRITYGKREVKNGARHAIEDMNHESDEEAEHDKETEKDSTEEDIK